MKLFEFLKLVSSEKFPFTIEYEDWSGNIKVKVDTFSHFEEYHFDNDGVTEFVQFQMERDTEDNSEIVSKIADLSDRPKKAWIKAANDLGIRFIHPYTFKGMNGEEYEVTGLLPDFGTGKGVLITDRKTDEEAIVMADLTGDYVSSGLNPTYFDKYDRKTFTKTLSDWGWNGKEKEPEWMKTKHNNI